MFKMLACWWYKISKIPTIPIIQYEFECEYCENSLLRLHVCYIFIAVISIGSCLHFSHKFVLACDSSHMIAPCSLLGAIKWFSNSFSIPTDHSGPPERSRQWWCSFGRRVNWHKGPSGGVPQRSLGDDQLWFLERRQCQSRVSSTRSSVCQCDSNLHPIFRNCVGSQEAWQSSVPRLGIEYNILPV